MSVVHINIMVFAFQIAKIASKIKTHVHTSICLTTLVNITYAVWYFIYSMRLFVGALDVCFFYIVWLVFSRAFEAILRFQFVAVFLFFSSSVFHIFRWRIVSCEGYNKNGRIDDKFINIIKGLFSRWWRVWVVILILFMVA